MTKNLVTVRAGIPFATNGWWHIVVSNGFVLRGRWLAYSDMAKAANRLYGLNNWTYEWEPNRR